MPKVPSEFKINQLKIFERGWKGEKFGKKHRL